MQRSRQIVVAGTDRRFLRIAAFLLSRRGHLVRTTADAQEALDLVQLYQADVAIVDGNTQPATALRIADDIDTKCPSVVTFVVADEPCELERFSVKSKWRAVRRLPHDVEQAFAPVGPAAPAARRLH
jgi:CheY-like chemotaxis protein